MSKEIKLNEIAEILTGFSFREAIYDYGNGIAVVQARDIGALGVDNDGLVRVQQDFPILKMLQRHDILLTSRGSFRSAVYGAGIPAVASSSLFVLRVRNQDYLPEFLSLYLNSPKSQIYLTQSAKGATMQSLSKVDVAGLLIPDVPIEQQKLLVELQKNIAAQAKCLQTKINTVNEIFAGAINQSIKGVSI